MTDERLETRRLSFGRVAELYEEARPSYPADLVDDVLGYAALRHGEPILEVGAGTGKATRLFAARGHPILALEPSARMLAVARTVLTGERSVELVESDFESWPGPRSRFGLLISAQAWHWTRPETRYAKAREVLRGGGALAVFWNWPDWRGNELRSELDHAYAELAPSIERGDPMRPCTEPEDLADDWEAEIGRAGGFGDARVRHYDRRCRYTSTQYLRLLGTTSEHALLEQDVRERLLERIAAVIDEHGGAFELVMATQLCLARAA